MQSRKNSARTKAAVLPLQSCTEARTRHGPSSYQHCRPHLAFPGLAGTRELREGRASIDRMRSHIASALSTTERGVEKDSKQRGASTASHMVMSEINDLRRAICATKHVGQRITRFRTTKSTSVAWPCRSPHQTPSIASLTGCAGSLAASTSALP